MIFGSGWADRPRGRLITLKVCSPRARVAERSSRTGSPCSSACRTMRPRPSAAGPKPLTAWGAYPHVALLEIGLPKMDGHKLAQLLGAMPGLDCICLIAVTGNRQAEDHHRARPPRRVRRLPHQAEGADGSQPHPAAACSGGILTTDPHAGDALRRARSDAGTGRAALPVPEA